MSANGQLAASELRHIGGGKYLRRDAARAFLAMDAESVRRGWGHIPVSDAYRIRGAPGDYARGRWSQWMAWERYRYHGGNLAAYPGTSNHGWGLAIDLASRQARWIVDQIGEKYGWAKKWSDAPSEWWHIRSRPGVWKPPVTWPVLHRGMRGAKVVWVQRRLRAHGYVSVKATGYYGANTVRCVRLFQKKKHLTVDGKVGLQTKRHLAL